MGELLIAAPVCLYGCGWHFTRPCQLVTQAEWQPVALSLQTSHTHTCPTSVPVIRFSPTQSAHYPQGVCFSPCSCAYTTIYAAKLDV